MGLLSNKEGGDWLDFCVWVGGKFDKFYCFCFKFYLDIFRKRSLLCIKVNYIFGVGVGIIGFEGKRTYFIKDLFI